MRFEDLLNRLPNCPGAKTLPVKMDLGGFKYIELGLPEFIGPDLDPSSAIDQPSKPRIMIVSAAGAVGKSTLARQIAQRKKAPLWDLAQAAAVGNNSLVGQLTASFGIELFGNVSSMLKTGKLFIVVDALDEARIKANEAGFEAFIKNIAETANSATGMPILLLGRTQTAETTWLLLAEAGISASLMAIQPFTREQAEEYIEARIQNFDASAAKRIAEHLKPFTDARHAILSRLERAVSGDGAIKGDAAREFLGYAPVLETVAVLLAKEGNYTAFVTSLDKIGTQPKRQLDRPLAVLEHVVNRLLEREQTQKLQHNIKPVLEHLATSIGWNAWESLYSPDEQRTRLLGRILGRNFEACPQMPPTLRGKYEEQLAVFLPEHPFLREGSHPANKVFESYLFAIAMREYKTALSKAVEERIASNDYKPSRLLADFHILLGEQQGKEAIAQRQIGHIYDALLAGESNSLRVRLSIDAGDPDETDDDLGGEGGGEFELIYAAANSSGEEQIESRSFTIVEPDAPIQFRRQLKEASIVTRGTVVLGANADDFEIGPSVDIRCRKMEIQSAGLVVRSAPAPSSSDGIVLEAGKCQSKVQRKPIIRGSLTVCWPGAEAYPWTEYAVPRGGEEADNAQMHEVLIRFRRIVTSLRSHKKGSLARIKDKIEHQRVLKGAVGKAILVKLLNDGVIRLEGKFYHWVPKRADEVLGVSWTDLQQRRFSDQVRAYLKNFIEQNQQLF
jgi:hypothetical protein